MLALDAIDEARRAELAAEVRAWQRRPTPIAPDGEPSDRLDEENAEARMTAWRAWARRRELAHAAPSIELAGPGREADPAPTSG